MSVPRYWRFNQKRYTLTGLQCVNCGERSLTPRLVCPKCHSEFEPVVQRVFPTLAVGKAEGASASSDVGVTVLIPSYNAADTIRDTLRSVQEQDFDEPFEVVVVDSSSDDTPRIIADEFASVRLVHLEQQTDPGTARNLAITEARGEILACIDADCIAPGDWLRRMVAEQRSGHQVVGGTIENGRPNNPIAWAGYLGEFREWLPTGAARLMPHVPTCNISYHRSVFARFGGFPTRFYPQEDLLFHWRLSQRGISIWFDPKVRVKHMHRSTWQGYVRHLHRIGRITARVLKLTGDEGVFLARSPVLSWLSVPVLPVYKWLRTVGVFVSQQPGLIARHPLSLVLLLLGLYVWAVGFAQGAGDPPLEVTQQEALWQTG
jgi:cellulose synthase/poly-beta-1,6-N-acetylglucosamine synthase-like glycosyltransferase